MKLVLLVVYFLTKTASTWGSSPFRGSCKREGIFKKKAENYALTNHVIATLDVTSGPDCTLECLQHPKCVSYNFQNTDALIKKCELSDQTKTSNPGDYVSRPGYIYHDAEEFVLPVCSASPCLNNGKCIDQCLSDYTCECSEGYLGKNCETWIGLNGTAPEFAAKSCRHIKHVTYLNAPDGKYWIDPINTGTPFEVNCDMTTDGGGWLVVKNLILENTPPSTTYNGETDYRLLGLFGKWKLLQNPGLKNLKNDMGFTQIRYYCKKAKVGRVFHIMTTPDHLGYDAVRCLVVSVTPYATSCGSFTRLADDTSILSRNCARWGYNNGIKEGNHWLHSSDTGSLRMYTRMVVWPDHYKVQMKNSYYCDDKLNDNHSIGDTYKMFVR